MRTSPDRPANDEFVYPPPHPRRPMVLGAVGILSALCCPPLGIGLGVVSITQVRQDGGRYFWGVLAIVASVVTASVGTAVLLSR